MEVISTEKDYEPIAIGVENILNRSKTLPDKVFKESFNFFLFITFDELFMPEFFLKHLKYYLSYTGEDTFWVTTIDPDPRLYFGYHFDFWGAVKFSTLDTENEYLSALNNYPQDSPADALAHNSNLLMFFSPTNKWAVYGDRNAGIAVCAFTNREQMERFKSIYGSDLLEGVKLAAEYAYGKVGKYDLIKKLCNSYVANSGDTIPIK